MRKLTVRNLEVLRFLHDFRERNGSMPTRADIAEHFGWGSANSAETHLQSLVLKGQISISKGHARGIQFTPDGLKQLDIPEPVAPSLWLRLPVVDMARLNRGMRA